MWGTWRGVPIQAAHISGGIKGWVTSLRILIARSGKPTIAISDIHAAQFCLVKTAFDQQWVKIYRNEEALSFFSCEGIEWSNYCTTFMAERIQCNEHLVGVVKKVLRIG